MPRPRASLLARVLVPVGLVGAVSAPAPVTAAPEPAAHHQLARGHRTGVAAPATTGASVIDVVVPLHQQASDRAALQRLARSSAPRSTRAAQVRALAPGAGQARTVTLWAKARGFAVTSTTPWSVGLRGRADELAAAFGTSLGGAVLDGKGFMRPRSTPTVPSALAGVADTVVGLDTRPLFHGRAAYGGGDVQVLNSVPVRGSAAGAGATVATVNLSGWHPADLTTYRQAAFGGDGANPGITNRVVPGGHVDATVLEDEFGDETEVALDAEAIAGVAPGARQQMYFGPNSGAGYLAVLRQMATDATDPAHPELHFQTASTSWGACELDVPGSDLEAMSAAITAITAAGATFFAASGDSGAFGCGDGVTAAVDFPAAAPDTVAVGGTTVTGNAPSYTSTAWAGSGGGCSARVAAPARQAVAGNPCSGRAVPDIATLADPSSGFWVYDRMNQWLPIGGTSLAAPASAAGLAAAQAHAGLTTLTTPFLTTAYQNPAAFTDVTSGDNGLYRAGPGYDLVTGLGSPRWTQLEGAITGDVPPISGHNVPLLAMNPSPSRSSADVEVQTGPSSFESGFVPNGLAVTGVHLNGTGPSSCAAATPTAPAGVALPGTGDGTFQIGVSVTTSDLDVPGGCIDGQRPVVVDTVAPAVPLPVVKYVGTTSPAYRFSWNAATDATTGVVLYGLFVTDVTTGQDVAFFVTAGRAFPYASSAPFKAVPGHTYRVELAAVDGAWNVGRRTARFVAPYDDSKVTLSKHLSNGHYVSDWARTKATPDYLGSHLRSNRKGAAFAFRFTAKTVTLGVVRGPSGGYADVYLDGVRKSRISLYATGARYRQQVRVVSLATRGTHTLRVVVTGLKPSASQGTYVYLDSLTLTG